MGHFKTTALTKRPAPKFPAWCNNHCSSFTEDRGHLTAAFRGNFTPSPVVKVQPCISDWDSNLAKTHGLLTEITHLVSGLNEAQVLEVSSQKAFSERQSDR